MRFSKTCGPPKQWDIQTAHDRESSLYINYSKYSFHLSVTFLASVNTFPSLSLITLTCGTSFPSLSLWLANLYMSASPSLLSSLAYSSLFGFCYLYVHITMHLPLLVFTLFDPRSIPFLLGKTFTLYVLLHFLIPSPRLLVCFPAKWHAQYSLTCIPDHICYSCPVIWEHLQTIEPFSTPF